MNIPVYLAQEAAPDAGHVTETPAPAATESHTATDTHESTETASHAESTGGIGAIGVDPKALAFQLVNFAILFFILKKVAYKPILKMLSERHKKIEDSLKNAAEIEKAKADLEVEQERLLKEARVEAEGILSRAQTEAGSIVKEAEVKAQAKADQIVADAKSQVDSQVTKARAELKRELAGLVVAATEVVIDEKLDDKKDEQLIKKALGANG